MNRYHEGITTAVLRREIKAKAAEHEGQQSRIAWEVIRYAVGRILDVVELRELERGVPLGACQPIVNHRGRVAVSRAVRPQRARTGEIEQADEQSNQEQDAKPGEL